MNKPFEKRAFSATAANGLLFLSQFAQSILLVPILLEYWGDEKYGVWLGLMAFYMMLQTLTIGHQNYVGNEFNKHFHLDKVKAQKILGSGVVMALVIGLMELTVCTGVITSGFTRVAVGAGEQFSEGNLDYALLVLVATWAFSGSVAGILYRVILPLGMMDRFIYISLSLKLAQIAALFAGATLGLSIFMTSIIYTGTSLIYTLLVCLYIKRLMPGFFPWWKGYNLKLGWQNFTRSTLVTLNGFIEQFSNSGLIIVISSFLGSAVVPMFTTVRTVANTALQGVGFIINPIYPDLIRFKTKGEAEKLRQVMVTNWLITGFLVNAGFLLLLNFAEPLYIWWTKGKIAFDLPLFGLLIFSVAIANFNKILVVYLNSLNDIKAMLSIGVNRFFFTASVSLIGVSIWGLNALGFSLIIAEVAVTVWAVYFTRKSMGEIAGSIPGKLLVLALIPIVILGLAIGLMVYSELDYWIITLSALLLFTPFYFVISRYISTEVKERLFRLIPLWRK